MNSAANPQKGQTALRWVLVLATAQLSCGGEVATNPATGAAGTSGGASTGGASAGGGGTAPTAVSDGGVAALPEPPICRVEVAITFADPRVEASVRAALGLAADAPLDPKEVDGVRMLAIREPGVASLAGLECLTGLQGLSVASGSFSNLTPISGLKLLRAISMTGGVPMDLTPLSRLEQLDWLYLDDNRLSDIAPIARLHRLYNLSLASNEVHDVRPLLELANLGELVLDGNPVDCHDPIQQAALAELDMRIEQGPPPTVPRDRTASASFYGPCH